SSLQLTELSVVLSQVVIYVSNSKKEDGGLVSASPQGEYRCKPKNCKCGPGGQNGKCGECADEVTDVAFVVLA
ncbi:14125_t:CDS:2, partial [Funneliformis mosseae]